MNTPPIDTRYTSFVQRWQHWQQRIAANRQRWDEAERRIEAIRKELSNEQRIHNE